MTVVKTISSLFQRSVMEIYKSSRGTQGIVINFSTVQKLYIFSLLVVVPNILSSDYRVPLTTVILSFYQLCYL